MTWLPSYVKLFLTFVVGFVLQLGAAIATIESLGSPMRVNIFTALRLLGLLMIVVSPVLMGLKFFAQLDRKNQ